MPLINIPNVKQQLLNQFEAKTSWSEIVLSESIISEIQATIPEFISFNSKTCVFDRGDNIVIIPNQYFSYWVEFYDFCMSLKEYFNHLTAFRESKNFTLAEFSLIINELNNEKIISVDQLDGVVFSHPDLTDLNLSEVFQQLFGDSDEDKTLFLRFLTDKSFRLGKKILNNREGELHLRSDGFGSIVLKCVNFPDSSAGIFGRIAQKLTEHPDLYLQIVEFVNNLTNNTATDISGISKNRIIYGAPGTGKSFKLKNDLGNIIPTRVTFNPEYTYGQFVGAYKPVMKTDPATNEEKISYDLVEGPFLKALIKAKDNGNASVVLLIEELNRSNVSAVFGDVFQLLDRKENGESEYSITFSKDIMKYLHDQGVIADINEEVRIPSNLYIWATMNSADQGVFPLDSAFKRRWSFEYFGIDDSENEDGGNNKVINFNPNVSYHWNTFRHKLNTFLSEEMKVNEDKLIGPFFLSKKELASDGFSSKLLLYLWDDVLRHKKRSQLFLPKNLSVFHSQDVLTQTDMDTLIRGLFSAEFADILLNQV